MQPVNLSSSIPGIRNLFMSGPGAGDFLNTLVETLLHNPHPTLTVGERELAAAYVSRLNKCNHCCKIHGAHGLHHLGSNKEFVLQVLVNPQTASISRRMKALLQIADSVRSGRKNLTTEMIAYARTEGASDTEIYDIVLIADAFCMYNCNVAGMEMAYQHAVNSPEDILNYAFDKHPGMPSTVVNNDLYYQLVSNNLSTLQLLNI